MIFIDDGDDDNWEKREGWYEVCRAAEGRHQFFNKPLVIKTTQNTSEQEKEVDAASFHQDIKGRMILRIKSCKGLVK